MADDWTDEKEAAFETEWRLLGLKDDHLRKLAHLFFSAGHLQGIKQCLDQFNIGTQESVAP